MCHWDERHIVWGCIQPSNFNSGTLFDLQILTSWLKSCIRYESYYIFNSTFHNRSVYVNLKAAARYIFLFFSTVKMSFLSKATFVQSAIHWHIQATDCKCLFFFTLFRKQIICIVRYKFYLKKPQRPQKKWFCVWTIHFS